jgi:hypothetical protein
MTMTATSTTTMSISIIQPNTKAEIPSGQYGVWDWTRGHGRNLLFTAPTFAEAEAFLLAITQPAAKTHWKAEQQRLRAISGESYRQRRAA